MKIFFGVFLLSLMAPVGFGQSCFATNTNTGTNTGTGTGLGAALSVPCVGADGTVKNGDANTCTAILPQCSDLYASYQTTIKKMLSIKIMGYYQGTDADLTKSTYDPKATPPYTLVGDPLNYSVCSVVGHKMKYTDTHPALDAVDSSGYLMACEKDRHTIAAAYKKHGIEMAVQTIGASPKSCGYRPNTDQGDGQLTFLFSNNDGTLWNSYLLGTYPWLIRKNAANVLTKLDPNLSNVGDLLVTDSTMRDQIVKLVSDSNDLYKSMSAASQNVCKSGKKDIVKNCSIGAYSVTDPVFRICTLVAAQAAINGGAIANALLLEIMAEVKSDFHDNFANVISFQNTQFTDFLKVCGGDAAGAYGSSNRQNKSARASCVFDGANFYTAGTGGSRPTRENDCTGKNSRQATYSALVRISNSHPDLNFAVSKPDTSHTLNFGFAGFIESRLRVLCGQKDNYTNDSPCDTIGIGDSPVDP